MALRVVCALTLLSRRRAPLSRGQQDFFPEITTERLVLRQLGPDDVQPLFELFSDPDVMEFWSRLRFTSLDEAHSLVERITERYHEGAGIEWGVAWKSGGPLIGKGGFHRWHKPHFRAELGYSLVRRHWGEGVMREALPALLRYGFEQMELHSVEAQIDPGNVRSIKTVQRLGFVQEGHLRENFVVGDRFTDTLIFSLIRTPAAS